MSWLSRLFSSDYAKGAVVLDHSQLVNFAALEKWPDCDFDQEFSHALALEAGALERLVFKYWDPKQISYDSNSPEFPLCRDFSELCAAAVRLGAVKEGLKYRPVFFSCDITLVDGKRHSLCIAFLADGRTKFFEPQPAKFPWCEDYPGLKSLDTIDS